MGKKRLSKYEEADRRLQAALEKAFKYIGVQMEVVRCNGTAKKDGFNLKELNKNLIAI